MGALRNRRFIRRLGRLIVVVVLALAWLPGRACPAAEAATPACCCCCGCDTVADGGHSVGRDYRCCGVESRQSLEPANATLEPGFRAPDVPSHAWVDAGPSAMADRRAGPRALARGPPGPKVPVYRSACSLRL